MGIAFGSFRGDKKRYDNVIWQQADSLFPFKCDICKRTFEMGGQRMLASSLLVQSHNATACHCIDCHNGVDHFYVKQPKLSDRRTSLD
jgi:nitrate/TMAO reductase-like tetraheme cytochrome c subunit